MNYIVNICTVDKYDYILYSMYNYSPRSMRTSSRMAILDRLGEFSFLGARMKDDHTN